MLSLVVKIKLSAPYSAQTDSFRSDEAAAVTLLPTAFAISIADSPIPPEAPRIKILSSFLILARSTKA